ncbi:MAG: hypothetical protein MZV64_43285 [Ignavibacteriales bacterium]|nr:hypothetical protein [Ignavibacteriales bacterium]
MRAPATAPAWRAPTAPWRPAPPATSPPPAPPARRGRRRGPGAAPAPPAGPRASGMGSCISEPSWARLRARSRRARSSCGLHTRRLGLELREVRLGRIPSRTRAVMARSSVSRPSRLLSSAPQPLAAAHGVHEEPDRLHHQRAIDLRHGGFGGVALGLRDADALAPLAAQFDRLREHREEVQPRWRARVQAGRPGPGTERPVLGAHFDASGWARPRPTPPPCWRHRASACGGLAAWRAGQHRGLRPVPG